MVNDRANPALGPVPQCRGNKRAEFPGRSQTRVRRFHEPYSGFISLMAAKMHKKAQKKPGDFIHERGYGFP